MKLAVAAALMAAVSGSSGPVVDDLAWMAGRWESVSGDRWTEEYWSAPRGGAMIGYSRSGQGESTREFEFLRLAPGADGVPAYLASPAGRPPVAFRLVEQADGRATFANPSHDYPQRIVYRREGDTMVATISLSDGANATSWTYRLGD